MADRRGDESGEEEPTIAEDVVVTKYKMAGDMANRKYHHHWLQLSVPHFRSIDGYKLLLT